MSSVTAAEAIELETLLREESKALGFSALAITRADSLPRREFFERWLRLGFGGKMSYLSRNVASRMNPREAWPEVRTVVTVALNYHAGIRPAGEERRIKEGPGSHQPRLIGAISRYAWGRDYHKVVRKRLLKLARLVEQTGLARVVKRYVDTGPVIEREWGAKSGLGWIGKNTLLLNSTLGSWFFIGVLFLDVELSSDRPHSDLCGSCDRCIRACPTGALVRPYVMDARRCISYLNIELRGWIPRDLRHLMGNWVFGCDDCQSVCPYNQDAPVTTIRDFQPREGLNAPVLIELLEMSEEMFRKRFEGTPLLRARWTGLVRNAAVALGNSGDDRAVEPLGQALQHSEAIVRGHAAWGLGNLGGPRAKYLLEKQMKREKDPEVFEEITDAIQMIRGSKTFSQRVSSSE